MLGARNYMYDAGYVRGAKYTAARGGKEPRWDCRRLWQAARLSHSPPLFVIVYHYYLHGQAID